MINKKNGFTLIELIITVALFVIFSGIGVLAIQGYTLNKNLKTAARDIASDISNCRQRAVSENVNYRITFTVDASNPSNYIIEQDDGAGNFNTISTKSPSNFGADVRITNAAFFGGGTTVNIFTRGTVQSGNVQLRNSKGSTATVRVNQTGRTYVTADLQ